jgi:hypothetical protein
VGNILALKYIFIGADFDLEEESYESKIGSIQKVKFSISSKVNLYLYILVYIMTCMNNTGLWLAIVLIDDVAVQIWTQNKTHSTTSFIIAT